LKKKEEEVMLLYGNGFKGLIQTCLLLQKRVSAFLIDETMVVQIGSDEAWLWIATIAPLHQQILGVYISRHRNMIVTESFLRRSLVKVYGKILSIVMVVEHDIILKHVFP
jgi:hypothetical protein